MQAEREDELLRRVAIENAKSILLARQRAEEELVRAKEALERKTGELAGSLAMMRGPLGSHRRHSGSRRGRHVTGQ